MSNPNTLIPILDGQPVFGDPSRFVSLQFDGTMAESDAFLGLPAGTTTYPPAENGTAWAVSGVLVGPSSAAVMIAQATLAAFAGLTVPFGRPTGLAFPGWFEVRQNCWFPAAELAWGAGGVVEVAPNAYQVGYRVMLHEVGGLVTPT